MLLRISVKRKIIQMAINDPLDVFDYDYYAANTDLSVLGAH